VYNLGGITLYLDGSPVASGSTAGAADLGAWPLRIGEDLDGLVNEQLVGVLDDVLVLNRALSGPEIQRLATTGAGPMLTLRVTGARLSGPNLVLDWEGGFDGAFAVQHTRSLFAPAWMTLTNTSSRSTTISRSGSAVFLRVVQ
jgi:hypothetical protein